MGQFLKAGYWLLILMGIVSSCSVGPPYAPPYVDVPDSWKNDDTCENCANEYCYLDFWWEVFDDEKLNELEQYAIENNRDLYVAFERIEEYRALVGIAAADFYPQINLSPLY